MAVSNTRPRVSTVVTNLNLPQNAGVNNKFQSVSKERESFKKPQLRAEDFTGKDTLDINSLVRILTLMQDHASDATLPSRSHPLGIVCIVQNVVMVGGQTVNIQHSLGEVWRYATILGSTVAGSTVCMLVKAANPSLPQDRYCTVVPTGTGTYDVAIYPG